MAGAEQQAARTLSLAAGVLPEHGGPKVAEAAAAAGYSHFGVTVGEDWTAADTRAVRALMRTHGLHCLDAEVIWLGERAEITDRHRQIVAVGAELEADNLLVVSDEPDLARTADGLHQLCELAAPNGQRVCLEFLRITAISRPSQALAAVRQAAHPAVGILVDSLHLARSGEAAAILAGQSSLLPYLQLCDAPANFTDDPAGLLEDALDRRSAPGEGELPL
ncbi:MAG: TIM barrel protein, partial [Pseudomonadota bacterium]